jgi:hypothetical protein
MRRVSHAHNVPGAWNLPLFGTIQGSAEYNPQDLCCPRTQPIGTRVVDNSQHMFDGKLGQSDLAHYWNDVSSNVIAVFKRRRRPSGLSDVVKPPK